MTTFLLGALVTFSAAVAIEGYFLIGFMLRQKSTFEQILQANVRLLALHPSKSADRTVADADADAPPFVPFQTLRRLAAMREWVTVPVEAELDRWADDGGAVDLPQPDPAPITEPIPVVGPETRPQAQVLLEHAFTRVGRPVDADVVPDAADLALATFTFQEGYVR